MSSSYTQNPNTGSHDTGSFTSDSDSSGSVIVKTAHSNNNNKQGNDIPSFHLDDFDDDTHSIIYHGQTNTGSITDPSFITNAGNTNNSDNNSNKITVSDSRMSIGRHSNASKNSDLSTGYSLYTAEEGLDQPEDENAGNSTGDTNANTHRDDTPVNNSSFYTMSTDGYSVDINDDDYDDDDDDDDNDEDMDIDLAALKSFTPNDEDDQVEKPVQNFYTESFKKNAQQDNNNSHDVNSKSSNYHDANNATTDINYNFLSVPTSSGIPIDNGLSGSKISRFPSRASALTGISEITNLTKATTTAGNNNRNGDYSLGGVSSNLTRGITRTTTGGSSSTGEVITNNNDLEDSNTNSSNVNIIEVHRLNDNLPSVKPVVDYQDKLWSTLDILDDVRDVSKFKFFDNDYYLKLSTLKKSQIKLLNDLVDVNKEYMKFDEYYEKWNKNKVQNDAANNNSNDINPKDENVTNSDMNTNSNTKLDNTNTGIGSNNDSNENGETGNQKNSSTPNFIEGENLFDNAIFNDLSVAMNEVIINDLQEIKKNISTIDGHSRNLWQQIQ
ncbi:unnamed protein product [[Candida] boidinii]|nr:unnamed protein product [[Candida] boidinii]